MLDMVKMDKIVKLDEDVMTVTVEAGLRWAELIHRLDEKGYKRLPILKESDVFEALLYREDLRRYLKSVAELEGPPKTINDILTEEPTLSRKPAFVSRDASLADAIWALQRIKDSKVVFVTEGAVVDEPVLGMLTNSDIVKHART